MLPPLPYRFDSWCLLSPSHTNVNFSAPPLPILQRIHAFVPESPAVIIDQDDDVAVAVDDVNDVPIDPSLAGLQISVSITGDIDIRHVSEPSTLHADRGKDPSAARLVGSRQQDVTSALQVVESRSVSAGSAMIFACELYAHMLPL